LPPDLEVELEKMREQALKVEVIEKEVEVIKEIEVVKVVEASSRSPSPTTTRAIANLQAPSSNAFTVTVQKLTIGGAAEGKSAEQHRDQRRHGAYAEHLAG
jgi:hypothetical protein